MSGSTITFGVMADIHQDFMYRAEDRLKEFIQEMNRQRVDFIIQLGDFCFPTEENRSFVNVWEQFSGPKYHVLGNHDMDRCDKKTIMNYLGMADSYYSFDCGNYHFVVLDASHLFVDGEYKDYEHGNYHKHPQAINHLTPRQLEWLREDLEASDKTTIIFSHQNLESPYNDFNYGLRNSSEFREVVREANRKAGFRKVIACMNGHNHLDGVKVIDDVYYIHINSMSYFYMGKEYESVRYSEEVSETYPLLKQTAPYKDPLYAVVTLEPGQMTIKGIQSEYAGPTPVECGHRNHAGGHEVTAGISDRVLKY